MAKKNDTVHFVGLDYVLKGEQWVETTRCFPAIVVASGRDANLGQLLGLDLVDDGTPIPAHHVDFSIIGNNLGQWHEVAACPNSGSAPVVAVQDAAPVAEETPAPVVEETPAPEQQPTQG